MAGVLSMVRSVHPFDSYIADTPLAWEPRRELQRNSMSKA